MRTGDDCKAALRDARAVHLTQITHLTQVTAEAATVRFAPAGDKP